MATAPIDVPARVSFAAVDILQGLRVIVMVNQRNVPAIGDVPTCIAFCAWR